MFCLRRKMCDSKSEYKDKYRVEADVGFWSEAGDG